MDDKQARATLLRALDDYRSGALEAARTACTSVLGAFPSDVDALNLLGLVLLKAGAPEEAAARFRDAVAVRPDNPGMHNNLGMALRALQQPAEALAAYARAIALHPGYAPAHANHGNALMDLGRFAEALASYDRALALRPDHPETLIQRGIALQQLNRHPDALASFERCLAAQPDNASALERRGRSLTQLGRTREAIESLEAALRIAPEAEFLRGILFNERKKIWDWRDHGAEKARLEAEILAGKRVSPPFHTLGFSAAPHVQRKAAEIWIAQYPPAAAPLANRPAGERIHLGFFSADFYEHATMHLMAEVIARFDRTRFRLSAFSSSAQRDSHTEAARTAFDDFVDVGAKSDLEAAQVARELSVDIALDVQGYTRSMRPRIFLNRAAPVQVSYLAYPGTTASPAIDYLIADETVVPASLAHHYSEQIACLPHSYQPRDTRIAIGTDAGSRADHGLPDDAFVFCCFNNAFKLAPDVFALWTSVLHQVPGSVLWLLQDQPDAIDNLRREATARGIGPERLVFAGRAPFASHLARHRHADLFLDTLPYNAHTTASDALVTGLPVLTRRSQAFAGRVAASLLNAIGLPELITETDAGYEDMAVRLAQDPAALAALRERLRRNIATHPLFDMAGYTRDLETLFELMHRRRLAGLPPVPLNVGMQSDAAPIA